MEEGSGPCREPASLPCHLLFFARGLLISSVPIATVVISENIAVTRFLFYLKGAGLFLHPHGSIYLLRSLFPQSAAVKSQTASLKKLRPRHSPRAKRTLTR